LEALRLGDDHPVAFHPVAFLPVAFHLEAYLDEALNR
jgi:hypothetical protein